MKGAILLTMQDLEIIPLCEFGKPLEEKGVALKVITGYTFDNKTIFLSDMCGNLFWFSLSQDRNGNSFTPSYNVMLWNVTGNRTVYTRHFTTQEGGWKQPMEKVVRDEMVVAMDRFMNGTIKCSDCGEDTEADAPRSYFAGTYCVSCWAGLKGAHKEKGGWREVEAKETYN